MHHLVHAFALLRIHKKGWDVSRTVVRTQPPFVDEISFPLRYRGVRSHVNPIQHHDEPSGEKTRTEKWQRYLHRFWEQNTRLR